MAIKNNKLTKQIQTNYSKTAFVIYICLIKCLEEFHE